MPMDFIYDEFPNVGKARSKMKECQDALEFKDISEFKFELIHVPGRAPRVRVIVSDEYNNIEDALKTIRTSCIEFRQHNRALEKEKEDGAA